MINFAEILGGAALIVLGSGGFSILWQRISNKQDTTMCEVLHKEIKDNLANGDKKFQVLGNDIKEQGRSLVSIDKNLALIAQKIELDIDNRG